MPPTSMSALLVVLVAVVPGAVFCWTLESGAALDGGTFPERVLRYIALSVVFGLVLAGPGYAAWRAAVCGRPFGAGQVALLLAGAAAAIALPTGAGLVLAGLHATRHDRRGWRRVRRLLTGDAERRLLLLAFALSGTRPDGDPNRPVPPADP
jgi:hypothetical protein